MSHYKAFLVFTFFFAAVMVASSQKQSKTQEPTTAQAASGDAQDIREMLFTDAGLLAFDTAKDWGTQ